MARKPAERFCVIAPIVNAGRNWYATQEAAVTHASALLSHASRSGASFVVVKAVAIVEPARPIVPVSVSHNLNQLSLAL